MNNTLRYEPAKFSDLVGCRLREVANVVGDDDEIFFTTDKGVTYKLFHEQDCCECVYIESVVGDLRDLVGEPILVAEEVSNSEGEQPAEAADDSFTWTFYKLATRKGYVDIRWFGSSNGYYSEDVSFVKLVEGR